MLTRRQTLTAAAANALAATLRNTVVGAGHLPLDLQRCINELSEREFAFLNAPSPAAQDTVIACLQDMDSDQYAATRKVLRIGGDAIAPQAIERGLIDA